MERNSSNKFKMFQLYKQQELLFRIIHIGHLIVKDEKYSVKDNSIKCGCHPLHDWTIPHKKITDVS